MNTKTMRLPPRRVLTPDKRKARDCIAVAIPPGTAGLKPPASVGSAQFGSLKAASAAAATKADRDCIAANKPSVTAGPKQPASVGSAQFGSLKAASASEPVVSNQLLAGYLAHEFLAKGTLFGEPWDPAQAQAAPDTASSAEPMKGKPSYGAEPWESIEGPAGPKRRRYVEVVHLLRADGTHLPGIVNPAQVARFLKL